jgi:hypothetical protein
VPLVPHGATRSGARDATRDPTNTRTGWRIATTKPASAKTQPLGSSSTTQQVNQTATDGWAWRLSRPTRLLGRFRPVVVMKLSRRRLRSSDSSSGP